MASIENYRDLLIKLLPPGKAWKVEPDSWMAKLLEAFAVELSRVDQRVKDLIREGDPAGAFETLPEWEKEFGLPDECSVIANNVVDRRIDLIRRIATYGGSSAQYFTDIFALSGISITISYKKPSYIGAPVGGSLDGPALLHTWYVHIPDLGFHHFKAGESAGKPLVSLVDSGNVICLIEKYKPAHTVAVYTFDP